jgi:type VI secretion system secreted protein VgrG
VHLKAGTTLVLEASAGLSLKVGGNFITMLPAGIFIQGTMVMINSGGAALSGSGSSPQAPAAPTTVEDGKPGKQPPMPTPKKPTKYSPQAQAMILAAKKGTPFVAVQAPN